LEALNFIFDSWLQVFKLVRSCWRIALSFTDKIVRCIPVFLKYSWREGRGEERKKERRGSDKEKPSLACVKHPKSGHKRLLINETKSQKNHTIAIQDLYSKSFELFI